MHVLLIEGNEDDACLIGELLTDRIAADIELEWTDQLGIGLTRVTEGKVDVVLLDLSLPDSHGLETLDTIQARAPDLPIIVLTHLDDEGTAVQAVRKGAQDYLVKGRSDGLLLVRAIRYAIERKQSAKAVRDSETRLRTIINTAPDALIGMNAQGIITEWNPRAEVIFGWSHDEALGQKLSNLILPPRQREAHDRGLQHFLRTGEGPVFSRRVELTGLRRNGIEFPIELSMSPVQRGETYVFNAFLSDITERKGLEAQLRHSQKMEGVGQLAGGIAHDFNNLLTVINGYSAMVLGELDFSNPFVRDGIEQIKEAGHRAALLTRQLLLFSRQQVLQPKVLDLNEVVSNIAKLLRRLIGEDITQVLCLHPALGRVKIDPGQIEQIIMNLAVNARDAMSGGGQLTIETENVELDHAYARTHALVQPGPYVMLAVSDTGCGMDADTQARIFEPFFTTKGPGNGTGLGLATVDGIVNQSGGHIGVYSEVGKGTVFKIYLPQVAQTAERPEPGAAPDELLRGSETVLLVEDDEMVRALAQAILERSGYHVLAPRNVPDALHLAQEGSGPIHLLLTDTIMPGMNGPELAKRVRAIRPETQVLLMSGYTDKVIAYTAALEPGTAFLQKPFTPQTLTQTVREVLNAILPATPHSTSCIEEKQDPKEVTDGQHSCRGR